MMLEKLFMVRKFTLVILFILTFQANAQEKTILILADSLSASYGIAIDQGWVSLTMFSMPVLAVIQLMAHYQDLI
jgi:hypothetical protein